RVSAAPEVLDDLAGRYDVAPGRIQAVARDLTGGTVGVPAVRTALREITAQQLTSLATRCRAGVTLADLLYAPAVGERIAELVHRVRHRHQVLSGWGFADKAHESYGITALFSGPSGTGKTAAAAAIANALEIDLYAVDISRIMSKWVG